MNHFNQEDHILKKSNQSCFLQRGLRQESVFQHFQIALVLNVDNSACTDFHLIIDQAELLQNENKEYAALTLPYLHEKLIQNFQKHSQIMTGFLLK